MTIQKIENSLYNITFEDKRLFGTNEYDLYVTMEGNKIKNINSGSVITHGEWLNIEDFTELKPLIVRLNTMLSAEQGIEENKTDLQNENNSVSKKRKKSMSSR